MHGLPRQRKLYMEAGACARPAFHPDGAAMLAHDAIRYRQAQSSSFAGHFRCEEGIVDSLQMFRCNSLTRICYFDASEPVLVAGFDGQCPARLHRVASVQEEVQEHL